MVKRIFFSGHGHPGENQTAAAAYQIHYPAAGTDLLDGFAGDAAVQGDKIHTVLRMQAHHIDKIPGGQGIQISLIMDDGIVHRYGTDHGRAFPAELLAERLGIAVAGQVHNGLSA